MAGSSIWLQMISLNKLKVSKWIKVQPFHVTLFWQTDVINVGTFLFAETILQMMISYIGHTAMHGCGSPKTIELYLTP